MHTFGLAVVVLLALGCSATQPHDVHEELSVSAAPTFEDFVAKYKKQYPTQTEYKAREKIFYSNMAHAAQLSAADPLAQYGMTKFSDISPDEFRRTMLISNFSSPKTRGQSVPTIPIDEHVAARFGNLSGLPTMFDWRAKGVVTGVYDQGRCGSCWAFSTTENVESMNAIAGHGLHTLSMQQLVDCDHASHGCAGGNPPNAYAYLISAGGQDTSASYPYSGVDQTCRFNPATVGARIGSWGYITQDDNENAMGAFTYQYGPPSVCVDASQWQHYTGGVVSVCGRQLDHCVQITGWCNVDGVGVWNVRNSWGVEWGVSGYLYVQRGNNVCGIGQEVTSSKI